MGTTRKDRELSTEGPRASGALSSDDPGTVPDIEPVRQFRTRVKVRSVERDTSPGGRWHDDGPGADDEPLPLQSAFEGACDVKGCAVCGSASHFLHIAAGAYSYRAPRFPEPTASFFSGRLLAQ